MKNNFFKQNYDRHVMLGYILSLVFNFILTSLFHFKSVQLLGKVFILSLIVYILAFLRESSYSKFYNAPFDMKDVVWSAVGASLVFLNLM
jgi:hypothetical protein